ncbi:MAG: hypothetical protein VX768_17105 [Planctomycetota bacterium]|nr:hypothetical protein [Planctomycetota bacterium]
MQYYIKRGEEVQGPYGREELIQFVKAKQIVGTDQVANDRQGPFEPLKSCWSKISGDSDADASQDVQTGGDASLQQGVSPSPVPGEMQQPGMQPQMMQQPGMQPHMMQQPMMGQPGMQQPVMQQQGDATGGIIPYKNPKALIAYYLGIVSGLPVIGNLVGVVALVLGILGLHDRKRNPAIKGTVHAWIGILVGGGFFLLWNTLAIGILVASM